VSFKDFYYLPEAFRKSAVLEHQYDIPMFSVFIKKDLLNDPTYIDEEVRLNVKSKRIKHVFELARNYIHKLGFPSMHSNVVVADLSKVKNQNTGKSSVAVGGAAYEKGKYMEVDYNSLVDSPYYATQIIIHEWAHLWMFNNSSNFKKAVKQHYDHILKTNYDEANAATKRKVYPKNPKMLSGKRNDAVREEMRKLVDWANSYGLSNNYELWATGIEHFNKLPKEHKDAILTLMRVTGSREEPNRRLKKHLSTKV
jgi:hypothetical protein